MHGSELKLADTLTHTQIRAPKQTKTRTSKQIQTAVQEAEHRCNAIRAGLLASACSVRVCAARKTNSTTTTVRSEARAMRTQGV
eukprot:5952427-Pleurochrysis_carterae.AAC.1